MTKLENHDITNILSGLNHLIQASNRELKNPALTDRKKSWIEARLTDLNETFRRVTLIASEMRGGR